jgi:hypothetical protein
LVFVLVLGLVCGMGHPENARIPYLCCLFAICAMPIGFFDGWNGRHMLLGLFCGTYFVMFGLQVLLSILDDVVPGSQSGALMTETESVIVVGALLVVAAYMTVVRWSSVSGARSRDWPANYALIIGVALWLAGTYALYDWYVYIVTDTTNEAFRRGLEGKNTLALSAFVFAQMLQPVGMLLMVYVWQTQRKAWMGLSVLAVVFVQVVLGFIADIKGLAMLGGILVILGTVLVRGRLPMRYLLAALAYVILVFPIFQAYRSEIHGTRGISRTEVVKNFGHILSLTLSAEERVNTGRFRAQTFWERSSLFGSVQVVVEKAGKGVAFQKGHTLSPILTTFVPRIIWSDKQEVPTGQLANRQFHFTDSDDIFISVSHLGELYWNFGWPGVIVGMSLIGTILGFIGARFNLADGVTITRLLVTVITIKEMILAFEGAIAPSYVVWLRSLACVGLLHFLFARFSSASRSVEKGPTGVPALTPIPYPNLLR